MEQKTFLFYKTVFYKTIILALLIFAEPINSSIIIPDGKIKLNDVFVNITSCNQPTLNQWPATVIHLFPNGNCINIYPQGNCSGRFIRYIPGRLEALYRPSSHKWEDDDLVKENLVIASLEPCFDKCDSRNWAGVTADPIQVTLYDDENFVGNETILNIQGEECFVIPPPRRIWESIKISGNESNSCIELHSDSSCGGDFTQFRPGYPHLHDLWYWGLGSGNYALQATAITTCGSYCNKTVPSLRRGPERNPGENIVTIYDFHGYYGNDRNLNLSSGCITLTEDVILVSIRTYGQCVILYGERDCQVKAGRSYTLQTGGMPTDYYVEKLLSMTIPMAPKSLQLCPEASAPQITPTTTSTPQITSTVPTTQASVMQVECVEKIEQTRPLSAWTVALLTFGSLILFVFGAVFGAFMSKKYDRISYGVNSERFNVLYKLQP